METLAQTWDLTDGTSGKWFTRLVPSLRDFAFLLPAVFLFFKLSGTKTLFADGDTGLHIRIGEWILDHRAIPTVDPFSFSKPHAAWCAWEWGWEVLFALIHRAAGLAGVGFVTVLLLGLFSVLLYSLARRASGNDGVAFFVTVLAISNSSIHWLARPHMFSWLFALIFLHVVYSAENGRLKLLYWLPPLTILWTNIHGSFFVGIFIILAAAAGQAASELLTDGGSWVSASRRARPFLLCALACSVTTLLNPYGWRVHQHIIQFLGDRKLMDSIQDFQTLSFHAPHAIVFESMLFLAVATAFWCLQSHKFTWAFGVILWTHWALFSSRNIPIFVAMATAPVAMMLHDAIQRASSLPALRGLLTTIGDICNDLRSLERNERCYALSVAAVLSLAALFAVGKNGFEGEFNSELFPSQAISIIQSSPAKHIFTFDQWGDYLIYRLYPSKLVFMDGRLDFYGDEIVNNQQHIIGGQYDWKKLLNQFPVDMVVVKPEAPLSTLLKSDRGWKLLLDDGKVVVFAARRSQASGLRADGSSEHPGPMFHAEQYYLASTSCLQDTFRIYNS